MCRLTHIEKNKSMEPSLVVAIICIVVLVVALVLVLTSSLRQGDKPQCSSVALSSLPDLVTVGTPCRVYGQLTELWYMEVNGSTYVVGPTQTPLQSICEDDQECEAVVTSSSCQGIIPVAKLGIDRYYPLVDGCQLCDDCV
uniref:Uncharacterized protein n=1 Tax=viral metagenome TaxID=1070528 RepID=A0A6C0JY38_9ZZZZ